VNALAILLVEPRDDRVWAAFSLAASAQVAGRRVQLFLSGAAAEIAARGWQAAGEKKRRAYCVPTIADLWDSLDELGVPITVCQTGMHLCELEADALRPGCEPGGMVGFLLTLKGAELVVV
jgi:predicted peroxiredoxin